MKFGITMGTNYAGVPAPEDFFHFVDRVEQLLYDSIWVGDHVAWTNPTLEALTVAAAYMARTKRLTFGTAILILPLRQPVVVAKMIGTMAYLSNGRFVGGFGVGGENTSEFEACGVPHNERGRRMQESLEIMRKLLTESNVSYQGKHFQLDNVSLDPKPAQHVPFWLGGRSEAAYKRAATLGDGWIAAFSSLRHFAESKAAIEKFGAKPDFQWVQFEYMHVSKDREKSKAAAQNYLSKTYSPATGERVESFASFGPGEAIAERLKKFEAAGCTHVIINPTATPEEKHEQIELIASEVLPLMK